MHLNEVLKQLRPQIGDNLSVSRISQALTNSVYKIETENDCFALRLNCRNASELGIDRHRETIILNSIKDMPCSPEVIGISKHWLLTRWVSGTPYLINSDENLKELTDLLSQIQQQPIAQMESTQPINIIDQINLYLKQLPSLDKDLIHQINSRCDKYDFPHDLVLCHHDWHPGNLIKTEDHHCLIDWEYAALGDPAVDMACFVTGFDISNSQWRNLCSKMEVPMQRLTEALCLAELMSALWFNVQKEGLNSRARLIQWKEKWGAETS